MKYHVAKEVSSALVQTLTPYVERIEVAGSVRREKSTVKDIELLCIPKVEQHHDLTGRTYETADLLTEYLQSEIDKGGWKLREGKNGSTAFGEFNKLLLARIQHAGRLWWAPVDVFSTTVDLWGWHEFLRTGPKDWNIRAMRRLQKVGRRAHISTGIVDTDGKHLKLPTEGTVFNALECDYVPPNKRR